MTTPLYSSCDAAYCQSTSSSVILGREPCDVREFANSHDTRVNANRALQTHLPSHLPSDRNDESPRLNCQRFCDPFHGNGEALAWCFDVVGRTVAILSLGAFLMPALLSLARQNAGCEPNDRQCDRTTSYGIKPSSWLTTTQTIVSVCASPLLPLMGAVVDYTSQRLLLGRLLSALFGALLFPMIFVSSSTWFAVSVLLVALFLVFEFQMVFAYAYLPELTQDQDELRRFTRNFTSITFTAVVVYMSVIVGVTGALHASNNAPFVAQIAMASSFAIVVLTLVPAWGRWFKTRLPLQQLPDNQRLWKAGFSKLIRSIRTIHEHPSYHPLGWFYIAIIFCDASLQSLPTILITFFTDQLGLSSADIGVAVVLLLLAMVPAAFLSAWCTKQLKSPIASSMVAVLILIMATTVAAAVLSPSSDSTTAYILVVFWGLGTGWKWTCDRMLSAALCPPQQSAHFMGLYLLCTLILTWLPPLVFTLLNESGISQRFGLAILDVFFTFSLVAYCCMGRYVDACPVSRDGGERSDVVETTETASNVVAVVGSERDAVAIQP